MIELKNLSKLLHSGEIDPDKFDIELRLAIDTHCKEAITPLIAFMSDDLHSDLNFSIIHGIESFPVEDYILGVIGVFEHDLNYSDEWLQVIHFRILNSKKYINEYKAQIARAGEATRTNFLNFCKIFLHNSDNKEFEDRFSIIVSEVRSSTG